MWLPLIFMNVGAADNMQHINSSPPGYVSKIFFIWLMIEKVSIPSIWLSVHAFLQGHDLVERLISEFWQIQYEFTISFNVDKYVQIRYWDWFDKKNVGAFINDPVL